MMYCVSMVLNAYLDEICQANDDDELDDESTNKNVSIINNNNADDVDPVVNEHDGEDDEQMYFYFDIEGSTNEDFIDENESLVTQEAGNLVLPDARAESVTQTGEIAYQCGDSVFSLATADLLWFQ